MTIPANKGPKRPRRFTTEASTFDPSRATPDASFPATIQVRAYGSATSTPFVYICDSGNHRIQVTDYDGNPLFTFGSYGSGNGQFNSPYGVTNDGTYVYVTDSGNHRVQYFDLYGTYVGQWGSYGAGTGQFSAPKGIATNGRFVFVIDQGNNRFQIFTMGGLLVFALGEFGSGDDQFNAPTLCYVDDFFLWIDDTGNNRIVWYLLTQDFPIYGGASLSLGAFTVSAVIKNNCSRGQVSLAPLQMQTTGATITTARAMHGAVTLPVFTVSGAMTTAHVMHGSVVIPALSVAAGMLTARNITGNVILPAFTVSGVVRRAAVMNGAVVLPALTISATGYPVRATPAFYGMAVNMRNKAITKYNGLQFNSFAVLNGKLYGATSAGIHLMEGDDDNGTDIAASIRTGRYDLHSVNIQRLVDAWLSARLAGQAVFYVRENEDDPDDITAYAISGEDTAVHDERISFARGHEGRFVEFEFANVEGSDFDIAGLTIRTHDIPRKR